MSEGAIKYERILTVDGKTSVAQLLRWIPQGSRVLEMGPATGIMTKLLLSEKNCKTTCIEIDSAAAVLAEPFCERMLVRDLNNENWCSELDQGSFDFVIFADVLEHLNNPEKVLQKSHEFLADGGEVLISIPNIGYVGVVSELLKGSFEYRRDGILDETHVRFFTRKSLQHLLNTAGLAALEWGRTEIAPQFSEFKLNTKRCGAAVRAVLEGIPDGTTYQFLVRATRSEKQDIAPLITYPPSPSEPLQFMAQVYFDEGSGFREEVSEVQSIKFANDAQLLRFSSNQAVRAIRIDPTDGLVPIIINSICVLEGENRLFEWTPEQGLLEKKVRCYQCSLVTIGGMTLFVPETEDGQLFFEIQSTRPIIFELEIDTHFRQRFSDLAEILLQEQQHLRSKEEISQHAVFEACQERDRAISRAQQLDLRLEGLEKEVNELAILREQNVHSQREKESLLVDLHANRLESQHHLALYVDREAKLQAIMSSRTWRMTESLRSVGRLIRLCKSKMKYHQRRFLGISMRRFGRPAWVFHILSRFGVKRYYSPYDVWRLRFVPSQQELSSMRIQSATWSNAPLFSIIVPVYKSNLVWLKEAIESVRQQAYQAWELCIADDHSNDPGIRSLLETYQHEDKRIKVIYREVNGHISDASNSALQQATGDYVVLLDHDDALAPHALYRLADAIRNEPSVDVLYSDEDKISEHGLHYEPTFKSEWSPEYMLSFMYTGHISCFRRSLVKEIGGFRVGVEGSQDYDLMLRITEKTAAVKHVDDILYHWRAHEGSVAGNLDSKPYAFCAAKRAISEALKRRSFSHAEVTDSRCVGLYQVKYNQAPKVEKAGFFLCDSASFLDKNIVIELESSEARATKQLCQSVRSFSAEQRKGVVAIWSGASKFDQETHDYLLDALSNEQIGLVSGISVSQDGYIIGAGASIEGGRVVPHFVGSLRDQVGYRGRLVIPSNVQCVCSGVLYARAELFQLIPDTISSFAGLALALSLATTTKSLRVLMIPSCQVISKSEVSIIPSYLESKRILNHFPTSSSTSRYFPEGLRRFGSREGF
jgi:glycosyltransferase involved in cell wall biosynthesis/2-polyprenyl-3-methyl-5-hydroxy-6-metoxy-1,4-benzoquinol methylase